MFDKLIKKKVEEEFDVILKRIFNGYALKNDVDYFGSCEESAKVKIEKSLRATMEDIVKVATDSHMTLVRKLPDFIDNEIDKIISTESFINKVVEKINRKQLK